MRFPPSFRALLPVALVFTASALHGADAPPAPKAPAPSLVTTIPEHSIRLWEGAAPGALGDKPQDIPTLTPFPLPEGVKANGASMVVLPGGGYTNLAPHEGQGYAEWFAQHGVTAYVLRYRLGSQGYHHPIELGDVARAIRLVRTWAKRDGLDPARVGVIGSSAGGHLASSIATMFDAGKPDATDPVERESSRPDLAVLCYPVITFGEFAHAGSRTALLGKDAPAELVKKMSTELQVTKDTPPCFLWHTVEDRTVPVENSLMFAAALRRNGVPFSLHIYEKGAHGLGMRPNAPPWADQLLYWLKERKFVP